MKSKIGIILMLLCAAFLCIGQFVWKAYDGIIFFAVGLSVYGLGAIFMLCAYRFGSLSVLQPINSVGYVIAAILGSIFFQEVVTTGKVIGIALIMVGVVLLARDEVTG